MTENLNISQGLKNSNTDNSQDNLLEDVRENHVTDSEIQKLKEALKFSQDENGHLQNELWYSKKKYSELEEDYFFSKQTIENLKRSLDASIERIEKQHRRFLVFKISSIFLISVLLGSILLFCYNGWIETGISGFVNGIIYKNPTSAPSSSAPLVTPSVQNNTPSPIPLPTNTPSLIGLAKKAEKDTQGQSLDMQLNEFQKQLNDTSASLRATKDTKKYTYSEEEVWQYCMNRWEYYDRLEGGYAGDKYTNQVFKDAGNKFGISATKAKEIWDKVDRSKYGLD